MTDVVLPRLCRSASRHARRGAALGMVRVCRRAFEAGGVNVHGARGDEQAVVDGARA
jgi:hypothetical protein